MFAARFEKISPMDAGGAVIEASCTFAVCIGMLHHRSLGGVAEAPTYR